MDDIKKEVLNLKDEVIRLRRDFHQHPEIYFQEVRTAKIVENYLKDLGLEVKTNIAKTGVVGLLKGNGENKFNENNKCETVLLRADMDALPIQELNNVPYKSKIDGVMHACGHDGHTAMLLVAAKVLSKYKNQLNGNVKFLFQPSEEKSPGGAIKMIEEGVLKNPEVNKAFGIHLASIFPINTIGIKKGIMTAEADEFTITVKGKGGHGAYPHTAIDPVVIASHVVIGLQSIVSRELDPLDSAVITVGKLLSGDVFNVIPEYAEIIGTVRTLKKEIAKTMPERIERIAKNISKAYRGSANLNYTFGYPPLVNNEKETERVINIAKKVVGADHVFECPVSMGGEDMSYFLEKVPGAFYWVGAMNKEKGIDKPHHNPYFNIDEDSLPTGVEMHVRLILDLLS